MKRGILLVGLAFSLCAGIVFAHAYSLHYDYLVSLSMPAVSADRAVTSAQARIGVLIIPRAEPGRPFPSQPASRDWGREQVVQLSRHGDHFAAKTRLSVMEFDAGPTVGPLMVEYRYELSDGQRVTTKAVPLTVTASHNTSSHKDYSEALARELSRFNASPLPTESGCVSLSLYLRGVPQY